MLIKGESQRNKKWKLLKRELETKPVSRIIPDLFDIFTLYWKIIKLMFKSFSKVYFPNLFIKYNVIRCNSKFIFIKGDIMINICLLSAYILYEKIAEKIGWGIARYFQFS